ncbi:phosphatidate phosphatase LPIN1 isoform X7 [Gallus gallus]|nr:phosphatidate phosphatase LPIN1 isoform X7 [Gallus gallus]XP_040522929.1 phosphatidate phosphatase LPIN1 isoform X7 [Gallus gallus]XP_040522930.1 phosphatidate phosphatase LPIN1 isoform X7 [Gallus gallus]XP_040522931.1 phosphatidate phosphatase LPIN1 isoform X7 [Gallus gallus]XP_046770570.1 phosphatidate phosphatase LPIN1 isoform X7 [Gallus gallus]XP_046770571.1 phosphatidate phosphatase LPIN1 isoform X7 [Gallus gallus]XP_046770572.1 phosphatidate phosphatase LPIN1 isoform X7 [Gallus gallu|eukprot:XP_004935829.2 phosphatidate phosphatase LPIN1 isoform X4 [Gallus gallus]
MNYVGQLAGQVFVTVKELYKGLNPATLSGCIDIIVVRQPDGNLQCSPFHVRFGKMGVLRSREKVVDIEINGEAVDLHMKLGDNGEAFFVQEMDNNQEVIPYHLSTSPILSEGTALMEAQLKRNSIDRIRNLDSSVSSQVPPQAHGSQPGTETSPACSSVKKRRKKRRKSTHKIDSLKREDIGDTSEDEDMFPIEISSEEEKEQLDNSRILVPDVFVDEVSDIKAPAVSAYSQSSSYPRSDGEWSPIQSKPIDYTGQSSLLTVPADGGLSNSCPHQSSHFSPPDSLSGSRPPTPQSDSELVSKPTDRSGLKNPHMHWAWGELPQATKASSLIKAKEPNTVDVNPSESTHFRVIQSAPIEEFNGVSPLPALGQTDAATADETEPLPAETNKPETESAGAAVPSLPANEEIKQAAACSAQAVGKTDSPSRKKDKRSRHLGADGVYLDDLTDMDPEVAALYFPKNGDNVQNRNTNDTGPRSATHSPQSFGSSGADSGVESTSDGTRDLPSIAISLCGGLTDNKEITKEEFLEHAVTYQQFVDNPAIIDDPNLVVKIGNKYYNWTTAGPLLLAMQAFQKPLPKATVESIMRDKMPKKGGRWWFSWRGRNSTIKEETKAEQGMSGSRLKGEDSSQMTMANRKFRSLSLPRLIFTRNRIKDESSSSDEDPRAAKQNLGSLQANSSHLSLLSGVSYKKTLRLTSDQLKSLKLKNGPNDVTFSVTTQYQGTCRCEGTIYLWNWDDKVIISDIDGTITRSDTLGHILPTLGKDWTHQGIAKLYHKVSQNGYKFLYCSARAIGMADMTRGYLHWVNERGTVLPQGPVLLSPSSLFSALHREVIEKKPEKFKVQCLTDIKNLFYPNTEPFYAAFGNRPADVYSYKQVGVSLNRIFTVNPKGELIQEHAKTNISSYVRLCEVVDHIFPLLKRSHSSDFPCSDTYSQFTYWREPLPPFETQDVHPDSS